MFASTSALRFASRRIATTSVRSISSATKAKGSRMNEEYFRKALPFLFAGGVAAVGTVQYNKVGICFFHSRTYKLQVDILFNGFFTSWNGTKKREKIDCPHQSFIMNTDLDN